jgi:hypothetical protein
VPILIVKLVILPETAQLVLKNTHCGKAAVFHALPDVVFVLVVKLTATQNHAIKATFSCRIPKLARTNAFNVLLDA